MPSSEGSYISLAKQTKKGTPNTTDADFLYLLLLRSGLGENNLNLPLDPEVGGGAMLRDVVKTGLTTGGPLRFIPRPNSIGHFLAAYFGSPAAAVEGTGDDVGVFTHEFKFGTNQFTVPYYTLRNSPAGMYGMQYQDSVQQALAFDFQAADFVRATSVWLGGLPTKVATTAWDPTSNIDGGPQFLSALSSITIPDGTTTTWKVLQGSVSFENAIPLDQQWILGSYVPDDYVVNQRAITISMVVKVSDDGLLYRKMAMDPLDGANWTAEMLRKGSVTLQFVSNRRASGAASDFHSIKIEANGDTAGDENVVFTVDPLEMIPGRQVVMNVTGTFLASPDPTLDPVTVTLVNDQGTSGVVEY